MMCFKKLACASALLLFAGCTPERHDQRSKKSLALKDKPLAALSDHIASLKAKAKTTKEPQMLEEEVAKLEGKLRDKRDASALSRVNTQVMADAMRGHTSIYPLEGDYHVMVVPVQFSDKEFVNPGFFAPDGTGQVPAENYLFGAHPESLSTYYRHASMGKLNVTGEVMPIVTVGGTLAEYGEAVTRSADKDARKLVTDALVKVKSTHTNEAWWNQFDKWDLGDYDSDGNYYEADGFVDAVILIYAGKAQSSCQRSFDPTGARPASSDVPPGPRYEATVECFNRIWPHRWSISISKDDPLFSVQGPLVEGIERPAMNGLKIHSGLFALDYNMQSEFSDRSTFTHEFGHSLSLPDIYANPGENSTGSWELMSDNAGLQGQDLSSYSKLSLGWLSPKVIRQGQQASAYLGAYGFVDEEQREHYSSFEGPLVTDELVGDKVHTYDVISETPANHEAVYRSLAILTEPTQELVKIVDFPEYVGKAAAYSGRFDGKAKSIRFTFNVPDVENPIFSFDSIYAIETETNFTSNDEVIKVVTDYDLGAVIVNNEVKEELRLVSGDNNYDSLNESNPACNAARALELRGKRIAGTLSEEEKEELSALVEVCVQPTWVKKQYDLSALRGQEVKVELRLTTDSGYTEFGVVVDNVKIGDTLLADFETQSNLGDWKILAHEGRDDIYHNQFYLMEYRSPGETYKGEDGKSASFNWDNHIQTDLTQSFFVAEGATPIDRFRLVEMNYQPGVLVWYFNSKYNRVQNGSSVQDGKGYLLVLNSKVKEVPIPGFTGNELFGEDGFYLDIESDPLKTVFKNQTDAFVCFSHIAYATYINGEVPVCEDPVFNDAMQNLTMDGKLMRYRRQWFNDELPIHQANFYPVGQPFRTAPEIRTALSTFRPASEGAFAPFKIFKVDGSAMVLDTELTAAAATFTPQDTFRDKDNTLATNERYAGDSVVVEKKGLAFRVASPSASVVSQYDRNAPAGVNESFHRRPLAKIYVSWE